VGQRLVFGRSAGRRGLLRPSRPVTEADSYDPGTPQVAIGRKVLKGGSHLCAPS